MSSTKIRSASSSRFVVIGADLRLLGLGLFRLRVDLGQTFPLGLFRLGLLGSDGEPFLLFRLLLLPLGFDQCPGRPGHSGQKRQQHQARSCGR